MRLNANQILALALAFRLPQQSLQQLLGVPPELQPLMLIIMKLLAMQQQTILFTVRDGLRTCVYGIYK